LALIAADQIVETSSVTVYSVRSSMSIAGFTDVATALALRDLQKKAQVEVIEEYEDGNGYMALRLTASGWDTLSSEAPNLKLKKNNNRRPKPGQSFSQNLDDEIPF
jgi:hypothetical protein